MDVRVCTECGRDTTVVSIRKNSRICRACKREREAKKYGLKNISKKESWRHKTRKYGITENEFLQMIEDQGGKCPICSRVLDPEHKDTTIDHCHSTGKIRGILCQWCNSGMGSLGDDWERLEQAARYLREHSIVCN